MSTPPSFIITAKQQQKAVISILKNSYYGKLGKSEEDTQDKIHEFADNFYYIINALYHARK